MWKSKQSLLSILRMEGPLSPAQLMNQLGISQPTLFRAVKAQSKDVVALGARRNRKIAALRNIRRLGPSTPIFLISSLGEVLPFGEILALHPRSFVFIRASTSTQPQFYPGLPFFLDDMRPQGFLGRSFKQRHADLKLPPHILNWNNDDIFEAIARRGEDLIGNILIGAESFDRYQSLRNSPPRIINAEQAEEHYIRYAQNAVDGDPAGSSVGGEQPKFGAVVLRSNGTIEHVLVKFSPSGNTFAAERWRDLLICESLSLEVLRENGLAAAESRIIEGGGRIFLETVRFDRAGRHGRRGVLSLSALENEWSGHGENWAFSAQLLAQTKRIPSADLDSIRKLECFGRLIANSDRHSGNLSFFWEPQEEKAVLAPIYDMLPMLYAPSSGGEDTRKTFMLPSYDFTLLHAWKASLPLAIQYWERVCEDPRISGKFKIIAEQNLKTIRS